MTRRASVCSECGAVIEWWGGGDGPAGWFDPDTHDLDSPGSVCPVAGAHEPETMTRQRRVRLTRRGRVALGVLIGAVFCVLPGEPPLPNAPKDERGVCWEDLGCEDGSSWLCRQDGNQLCGAGVDNASVTGR